MVNKQDVRQAAVFAGFSEDRYGNFKSPGGNIRIKLQATSVRVEKKVKGTTTTFQYGGEYKSPDTWHNIVSDYYKNVTIKDGYLVVSGRTIKLKEAA